jgi:hypothetical protein
LIVASDGHAEANEVLTMCGEGVMNSEGIEQGRLDQETDDQAQEQSSKEESDETSKPI